MNGEEDTCIGEWSFYSSNEAGDFKDTCRKLQRSSANMPCND